ncbi:MAG: hypothetical protein A2728_00380 [Candidatus Spechtbacteria bacterium RIFCSPHIGHO2_01_FULL_38_11]|nr:MAG: hypothetical protein A2728_00380 [Candidatus Spechtbacteria bacterium RIFCSPHIGHO2_01_FULL_38_11]
MIKDLLLNKSENEKANIKGIELAKLSAIPKLQRANGYIEVSKPVKINGGIRVYVRSWDKDNVPIGFGEDGTIETEKLNIINPPIHVTDPLGDIDMSWTDSNGIVHEIKAREDLQEALLQGIERTVESQGKDGKNIIKGSIGQTVSTIYGGGGVAEESRRAPSAENWATIRSGAGTSANGGGFNVEYSGSLGAGWTRATVAKGQFDTSVIGTDDISNVKSYFYLAQKSAAENTVKVYSAATGTASSTTYTNHLTDMATAYVDTGLSNSGMTTGSYYNMTFNETGRSNINKTGNTHIGLRSTYDESTSDPGVTSPQSGFHGSLDANPNYLEITHAVAPNNYTSTRSETITLIDNPVKSTAKPITNAVTLIDNKVFFIDTIKSEILTLIDTFARTTVISRIISEILTLTDAVSRAYVATLSEILTLVDTFTKEIIINKIFAETITLTDNLIKSVSRIISEILTLTDALSRAYFATLSEILTLVDTLTKGLNLSFILTETVTITDSIIKAVIGWLFGTKAATNWTNAGKASTTWTFTTENQSSYNP